MRMAMQKAPISRSLTPPSSTWPNRSAACGRSSALAPRAPRPISLMYWLMPMALQSWVESCGGIFSRRFHYFSLYMQTRCSIASFSGLLALRQGDVAHQTLELGQAGAAIGAAAQPALQRGQARVVAALAARKRACDGGLVHIEAGTDLARTRLDGQRRRTRGHEQQAAIVLCRHLVLQQGGQPAARARVARQQQGLDRGGQAVAVQPQRAAVLAAAGGGAPGVRGIPAPPGFGPCQDRPRPGPL